ncbi:MAG: methyltransferase [Bacteroidales bacterium]
MRVCTESVILGAYTHCPTAHRILDVGCGTGILSLMMAQKTNGIIEAIDICELACKDADYNFRNSNWNERLQLKHISFQEYIINCNHKYDCIISNPPYIKKSLLPKSDIKCNALHENNLSLFELFHGVSLLLNTSGMFFTILPFSRKEEALEIGFSNNLFLIDELNIRTTIHKSFQKVCLTFSKNNTQKIISNERNIMNENNYSEDYITLTKDFYLKF